MQERKEGLFTGSKWIWFDGKVIEFTAFWAADIGGIGMDMRKVYW